MTRRRVLVAVGTRPEAIKLAPVITALKARPEIDLHVLSTGQHADLLGPILAFHGIELDSSLSVMRRGQSLDRLTARIVEGVGRVLDAQAPALVLVQGDTISTFAAALAAHHRRIPVGHVEAGLRTGDLAAPWPEEAYRRMIASMATLHFAPTAGARQALLAEGHAAANIHLTGNTVVDAILAATTRLQRDPALGSGLDAVAARSAGRTLVTVTAHRRENNLAFPQIASAIARLAHDRALFVTAPLHPSAAVRAAFRRKLGRLENVALLDPLDYPHFVRLMQLSRIILTDSGGVQEEAAALNKPVLVLRDTTERPEGVETGVAELVGTCPDRIVAAAQSLLAHPPRSPRPCPYGDGRASERIADVVARG